MSRESSSSHERDEAGPSSRDKGVPVAIVLNF